MSFIYINPGYSDLLEDSSKATTIEDVKYNPYSGVALTNKGESSGVPLPLGISELYIKFCMYMPKSPYGVAAVYYRNSNGSFGVNINDKTMSKKCAWSSTDLGTAESNGIRMEALNDLLIYVKSGDSSTGRLTITVNGTEILSEATAVNMNQTSHVVLYSSSRYSSSPLEPLSNIIISDLPVSCGEKLALLPVGKIDTNMTENEDGSYSAAEAEQYCFQTLDVESLIASYGEASEVKGLYIFGNPAYCTGTQLTKAVACGRKNGSVQEYGTYVLETKPDSHAFIGGQATMTLGDLQGMEFGWKAGV